MTELLDKFESQTVKGLNMATVNAIQSSDTIYDSTKGLLIDPFANVTVASQASPSSNSTASTLTK